MDGRTDRQTIANVGIRIKLKYSGINVEDGKTKVDS
jgi:hypothetical protein